MYKITPIKTLKQGDELFRLEFPDASSQDFQIWDYSFLYQHPHLYRYLIVDRLECRVYEAIEKLLVPVLKNYKSIRIADIACGSGLMGKRLKDNPNLSIDFLAGIEINRYALTALERDTPGVYDSCFLVPQDNYYSLKQHGLNCLVMCGAANHLSLKHYQEYLSIMTQPGWIVFNLVADPTHKQRNTILAWMDEKYICEKRQTYLHRKLSNGEEIIHEVFLYKNH